MFFIEEPIARMVAQTKIIVIDGCSDIYDIIYPQFSRLFDIQRVFLPDIDPLADTPPPDAVVLIIGKSQYDTALAWIRQAHENELWAEVPIIPYLKLAEENRFFGAGVTDCWIYPIPIEAMITRLNTHIKAYQRLNSYRDQLHQYQKAYADQSHLIEIATHDIQHPINDLLMLEGLLSAYNDNNPQMRGVLKDMGGALEAMQEMVGDFLTALNLRGQMRFDPKLLPIEGILLDIGLKYAMRADAKQIEVLVGQTPGMIYADPKRVNQIVENLMSNAVKYSPPNKEVHVWSNVTPEGTYINVRDWGAGIPLEERTRLFSEFGKLSTRPTGNEGSVGLGLWVVKTLAEAMKGEAGAKFPESGGSIFWVRLPNHPPAS